MLRKRIIPCLAARTTAILIMLSVLPGARAQQPFTIIDAEMMKDRLDNLAIALNIPGYSVYLGAGDRFSWSSAYGYANLTSGEKAGPETCYHCASITKPVAAAVLLRLADKGKISLDEPVVPYLLPILQQYGISIGAPIGEVKVRHLLSHTSDDPAGSCFRYDGDKYSLLTKIITDVGGQPFEQLVLGEVCRPLGMKFTMPGTLLDSYPGMKAMLAMPYDSDTGNGIVKGQYTTAFNASTGLVSNVGDLARFARAFAHGKVAGPVLTNRSTEPFMLKNGARSGYGLGWYVEDISGIRTLWHAGYGYSTSGLMVHVPQYDLTFVILSNCNLLSKPFPIGLPQVSLLQSPFALELFRFILKHYKDSEVIPSIDWKYYDAGRIHDIYDQTKDEHIREMILHEARGWWNIARVSGDTSMQQKTEKAYRAMVPTAQVPGIRGSEIANISVDSKGSFTGKLDLPEDGIVRIFAIADGGYCEYFGMYDQVWIEDGTGLKVWQMTPTYSDWAGGHPRNRLADLMLLLKAGNYLVHFDNSKSPYNHHMGHWEAFPPDHNFWGIKIFTIPE